MSGPSKGYTGPDALAMAHRLRWHGARALARPVADPVRVLGLAWYGLARELCADLVRAYAPESPGLTVARVAGMLAATSPQVAWRDQVEHAPAFLESVLVLGDLDTLPGPGFTGNRRKGAAILLGTGTPDALLSGPKVCAFYACIMAGTTDAYAPPCIDRHAAELALGYRRTAGLPGRWLAEIQSAHVLAARWLGLTPRALQSLLWCDHKARTGTAPRWRRWARNRASYSPHGELIA